MAVIERDKYIESGPLPALEPLPSRRQEFIPDPSYWDTVSAAWQLEPIGQVVLSNESTFLDLPVEPVINIDQQIQDAGLDYYKEYFTDIRNQEHFDYLKEKINYNNHLRSIRDNGGLMPEIIAAFGDPITYLPIPFVKGMTFGTRFVKGAGYSAAAISAGEPVRHAYDPTATFTESTMYVGAGSLLGGTLIAAFGRRGVKGFDDPEINLQTPDKKAEKVFKETWNMENDTFTSDMYDADTPITYDVETDKLVEGSSYKLENGGQLEGIDRPVKILEKGQLYNGRRLEIDTIVIDHAQVERKFRDGTYVNPDIKGAINLPGQFASSEDYLKFLIKKEHIKFKGQAPDGVDLIDTENLLNQEVLESIRAAKIGRQTAGRNKERSWFAENVDRFITPIGDLLNNKLRNNDISNKVSDMALDMIGDAATVTRASKAGYAISQSALVKATANHFRTIGGFNKVLQDAFQKYRKNVDTTSEQIAGYNFGAIGIRGADVIDSGIRKLGGRKNVEEPIKFREFNELITKAIRDKDYYATAPKEIQEVADKVRTVYRLIGEEADKLGMFQNIKSVGRQLDIHKNNVNRALRMRKNHKKKYPKDKDGLDRIELNLKYAQAQVAQFTARLKKLEAGTIDEFNPLVEDYVNRVYDIDAILDDIANEDFIPPSIIPNIKPLLNVKPAKGYKIKKQKSTKKRDGKIVGAYTNHQTKEIIIDEDYIKTVMWPERAHQNPKVPGVKAISDDIIQDENDLVNFIISHEVHHTHFPKTKVQKMFPDEKLDKAAYENFINDRAALSILANNKKLDNRFFSIPKENTFRGILYNSFVRNKNITEPLDIYSVNARVDETIKNITRDAQNLDMEGDIMHHYDVSSQKTITAENALQHRVITATDKELMPFLINDINYLLRMYSERMYKRIEMARKFGDAGAENKLWNIEMDMLEFEYKGDGNLKEITKLTNHLIDSRDKVYNLFNTSDPESFFKSRLPATIRNFASTAMMGKVFFASVVDFARIPMVHGFANTFKYLNSKHLFSADKEQFNEQLAEASWLGDVYDVVMNNTSFRHIAGNEQRVGRGTSIIDRFFDKRIMKPMEAVQAPFYHVNLLSMWTHKMKEMSQHISTHRFLEDAKKVANGTASEFDIQRLASYGISKQEARAIGKLPMHSSPNGMLYTKQKEWAATKNGLEYGDKLRFATFMDVQRTIITPSLADKPNMMFGVIRINDEGLAEAFDNDVFRFLGGFEKTKYGGKFNNGWLALPFQFYAWSFAANRRLMLSGLSGREKEIMGGIIAMIGFAAMGDYMKNPMYYQHKSAEERIYRAIEMSGVTGLIGDINFALEVVSEGMFDSPMGVRPMLGIRGRFGEANIADATGEFLGPAPGMFADIIHALGTDAPFDEKAQTYRRLFPFNNLLWFDGIFKRIYNQGVEIIR